MLGGDVCARASLACLAAPKLTEIFSEGMRGGRVPEVAGQDRREQLQVVRLRRGGRARGARRGRESYSGGVFSSDWTAGRGPALYDMA